MKIANDIHEGFGHKVCALAQVAVVRMQWLRAQCVFHAPRISAGHDRAMEDDDAG